MARTHYHVIWDNGFEEEYGPVIRTKLQVQRAARNQALLFGRQNKRRVAGSLVNGWVIENPTGFFDTDVSWTRCSQEPCTAGGREDSPSLEGLPLP